MSEHDRAANRMMEAAQLMQSVASQIEFSFQQRRQWEQEYLDRIEAIVERELTFYAAPEAKP